MSACYRLAKFNLDTKQSDFFVGLPTPAMSLFVVFLPIVQVNTGLIFVKEVIGNPYFLIGVLLFFSYLMNAAFPMFSLKFKDYGIGENSFRYALIAISVILLGFMKYSAVPTIIIAYIFLSLLKNFSLKK